MLPTCARPTGDGVIMKAPGHLLLVVAVCGQQGYALLPPNGCAITLCPEGTVCREFVDLKTGLTVASCVAIQEKPGKCPKPTGVGICADTCYNDYHCKGHDKCCPNPCGALTCQPPVYPTCQNTPCRYGHVCVLKTAKCVTQPCYPVPTCVKVYPYGAGIP